MARRHAMVEPRVNLDDLRLHDAPARKGGAAPWILLLLLVPAAFAGGYLYRHRGGAAASGPVPVRTEAVGTAAAAMSRAGPENLTEGGWVEVPSYHPIVVSALTAGRVEELTVLEGSPVAAGQVVARLYSEDLRQEHALREAAVAQAKARLDLVTAGYRKEEVAKAKAEAEAADEEAKLAAKIAARTRDLVPTGAASREDLDRDEAAAAAAEAKARAAAQEHARLAAGFRSEERAEAFAAVAAAQADRDLAALRLSFAEVKSPAAGVVLLRHVTPGTFVSGDNPAIVSLYDPSDLQVRVDVRQENARRVRVGQAVEVTTESEPDRSYKGEVIRVDPLADLRKNTVQAKVKLLETGPALHPEMICRVRFVNAAPAEPPPGAAPGPLTVASAAVVDEGGRTHVFVVRGGRAAKVEVRLSADHDGRREVLGGLSAGERVVVTPPPTLADGAEVTETAR